jgi:outer membrane receptor protein involved in Fe transport
MLDSTQLEDLSDDAVDRIDKQVAKKEESIDFSVKYRRINANFRYNKSDYGFYPTTVGLGGENNINMTTVHGSLAYETKLDSKTICRVTSIFSREKYYIPSMSFLTPATVAYQEQTSRRSEIELNIIRKNGKFELLTGYRYRLIDDLYNRFFIQMFPDELPLSDFKKNIGNVKTNELFAQVLYTFSDNLSLISGIRYLRLPDSYSMFVTYDSLNESQYLETPVKNRDRFTGRIALIYSLNDNNIVKFMAGSAAQDRDEFAFSEPEEITTYEISHTATFDDYQLSSSVFYSNTDNIIQRSIIIDQLSGSVIDKSDNSGRWKTVGLEVAGWYKFNGNFVIKSSVSVQKTKDRNFSVEVGYSPNFLAKIQCEYSIDNYSIAANGYYVGSMETGYDLIDEDNNEGTVSIASRMGYDVGGYFNLGLNFRYNRENGFYVNFNGSNILDKKFHYPANEIANMKKGLIGQGRIVVVTAGYKF